MSEKKQPLTKAQVQKNYRARLKAKEENNKVSNDILSLDIVSFFEKATGFKAISQQAEFLLALEDPDIHQYAVYTSRQVGKSLTLAVWAVYRALHYPNQTILLSSAQESWVYDHITRIFKNNPEWRVYISWVGVKSDIPITGFESTFHSRVLLKSSTEKALRGVPADIVILDESEMIEDDALETAQGNLSGSVYKYVLSGTPPKFDLSGKFQKVITNPNKYGYKTYHWSKLDCQVWHSKEELEDNKKNYSLEGYRVDVMGLPLSSEQKGLFEPKHIKACTYPTVVAEKGNCESGIDGGGTGERDKYALIIIQRIGTRCKVRLVKWWNFQNINETPEKPRDYIIEYNTVLNKMDSQPEEFVRALQSVSKKKIFPVNMKLFREEALGHLKFLIKTHHLEVEDSEEELLKQLYNFTKKAGHDDCLVWALALACYQNDELFPVKLPTAGRITICDMNKRTSWSNFGNSRNAPLTNTAYPNNRNFVPNTPNKNRQPIYGK